MPTSTQTNLNFQQKASKKGITMALISSRDNKLIRDYIALRDDKHKRRELGKFVIEGARLAKDALHSGAQIGAAFVSPQAREHYLEVCTALDEAGIEVYDITAGVAHFLADTKNEQGIFCIIEIAGITLELENFSADGAYLALENIQDPGNLGTMLRTAEAMGLDGAILSEGCTDVYSPKTVRASMGAVFRLPIIVGSNLLQDITLLKSKGVKFYAAVADSDAKSILETDLSGGVVIVIGNEGSGLTKECQNACDQSVTIRMRGRAESLNAAAAGSVIMWEMTKHRDSIST